MSFATTLGPAAELYSIEEPLALERGGELSSCQIAFERIGTRGAPVVVALGGISAGAHIASHAADTRRGWWDAQVGAEGGLDPARFELLGIDFLGGAGASTGPHRDATDLVASFPVLTPRDQSRALQRLLLGLGIERLHAFVGSSYGGMVAQHFAAEFPQCVERLVVLCAPHRNHPAATAWRSLQRRILKLGAAAGKSNEAVSIARGLGMASYRTAAEFEQRFAALDDQALTQDQTCFASARYLEARGEAFAEHFTAAAFHTLSLSLDTHRIDPARIETPCWLFGAESDTLVPPWQMRELAGGVSAPVELEIVPSLYGHDAFLKEVSSVRALLHRALGGAS